MEKLKEKVSELEEAIMKVIYLQYKNEMAINKLHEEIQDFKNEMKVFKDEMKAFKDEMKDFKDEMKVFKDEMKVFKDEMKTFKDEMRDFKNEMKNEVKRMNKQWGDLANKLGTVVEDIVAPAVSPAIRKYFNCDVNYLAVNVRRKKAELRDEFDVVAVSDDCRKVFVVEVKSRPRVEYVNEFKNRKLERFRKLFEEYSGYSLVPVFASLRINEDILNYLTKNGIYALAYREWEYMDILNFEKLK